MGGNDTHDKYGRPYEMDDSSEQLYNRLEDCRDCIREFKNYLVKEQDSYAENKSAINIELSVVWEIMDNFEKIFSKFF